jgi:hypothetical protein
MSTDQLEKCIDQLINSQITSPTKQEALRKKLKSKHSPPNTPKSLGPYERSVERNTPTNRPRPEDAYQRAIIGQKSVRIEKMTIDWLDIELPCVVGGNSRVDLIGKNDDQYVLCELKYSTPNSGYKSDSPTYALLEILIYHLHIIRNAQHLDDFEIWHTPKKSNWRWSQYAKSKNHLLVVAANPAYWGEWKNGNWKRKVCGEIMDIKKAFGKELLIKIFYTPEATPLFSDQDKKWPGTGNRYEPAPLKGDWKELLELQ